jgi:hypothetical protein
MFFLNPATSAGLAASAAQTAADVADQAVLAALSAAAAAHRASVSAEAAYKVAETDPDAFLALAKVSKKDTWESSGLALKAEVAVKNLYNSVAMATNRAGATYALIRRAQGAGPAQAADKATMSAYSAYKDAAVAFEDKFNSSGYVVDGLKELLLTASHKHDAYRDAYKAAVIAHEALKTSAWSAAEAAQDRKDGK